LGWGWFGVGGGGCRNTKQKINKNKKNTKNPQPKKHPTVVFWWWLCGVGERNIYVRLTGV